MKPCLNDKCSRPATTQGECDHCAAVSMIMVIIKGAYDPGDLIALAERLESRSLAELSTWCRQEGAHLLGRICRTIFERSKIHNQEPEAIKRAVARACTKYVAFTAKVKAWEKEQGKPGEYMRQAAAVIGEAVARSKQKATTASES